ncbi:uncharacterized protein (DUF885 family) [Sphingomonas leidyi]|uniref:Uncharacterized protein (DUF885 family) n=1 Tax=Sphingomonas leidyi TaxID=68569 RepID=A0A7X5ZUS6_9SPHN|nr:DUF885 family protein [Sphingomonas leidyi]NIJ63703.1 uncharacterized protein (DUF885 family) [Sphingomonas leidyi]
MHRRQFLAAASVAALPRAALAVPNRDADLRAALDGLAKLDTPAARRARLKGFDPASLSPSARIDLETVRAGLAVDAELLRSLPVGRLGRSPYVIAPNAGAWREKAPDAQRIEAENAQIAADARYGVVLPAPLLERTRSGIIAAAGKATGPAAAALAGQARLLADLAPRAPKEPGTSRFPGGARYFALLLERHYGAAIAPAEAHRQMLAVAEALTARADAVLKRLGHAQGTVGARISAAFKDRRFLYSDDDAGRNRAVADMNATLAAARPHLPALFGPLPPECLNVSALRMPPQEEAEGKQGYRTIPAPGMAGAYFPDLARIRDRPSWTLPAVVHHELLPGHMIQLPIEAASEPHPLRIEYAPAFAEGWAIYAEQLMAARGAFAGDDHALLGHLHWLLFRIGRGLVDTGVHIGQETLAQTSSKLATLQGEAAYFAPMAQDIERICIEPAMRAAEALTWLGLTRLGSIAQRNGPESLRKFHRRLLADGRRRFAMIA